MKVKLNFDLQAIDVRAWRGQVLTLTGPWKVNRPRQACFQLIGKLFLEQLLQNKNLQLVKSYWQLLGRRSSHMSSSLSIRVKELLLQIQQELQDTKEEASMDFYLLVPLQCYLKRHALYDVIEHMVNSDLQPQKAIIQQVSRLFDVRVQVFSKGSKQIFNQTGLRRGVIVQSQQVVWAASQFSFSSQDLLEDQKDVQLSQQDCSQAKPNLDQQSPEEEEEQTKQNAIFQIQFSEAEEIENPEEIECPLQFGLDSQESSFNGIQKGDDASKGQCDIQNQQNESTSSTLQSSLYMPPAPERKMPKGYKPYKPAVFDFKSCRQCSLFISQGELCSQCFEAQRKASYKKLRQLSFGKREDQQQTNTSKENKLNLNNLSERRGLREQLKERTRVLQAPPSSSLTQRGNAR